MTVSTGVGRLLRWTGAAAQHREVPDAPGLPAPTGPPDGRAVLHELSGLVGGLRLGPASLRLARTPRGDGHVVVDVPGWKAPEQSGLPLRAWLRCRGYDARGWGFGTNHGDPERDARRLVARLEGVVALHGPVSLLGWSLGGVIAREVARERPDLVRRVITYGTPAVGGPTYTVGAPTWGEDVCREAASLIAHRDREEPINVPVTAIWSRRDAIVHWAACVDRTSPLVDNVEVGSTHLGLGTDPDVWAVVADRLARPVPGPAATTTARDRGAAR